MYFSQRFNVSAIKMRALGVFNPEFGTDNKMFVDPKLLEDAGDEFVGSRSDLYAYFSQIIGLIKLSKKKGDIPWETACKRMQFKETSNTSLGFSEDGTDGNGIGPILARRIVTRGSEILPHVDFAPDLFELIGVFAEKLGCDRLSDMLVSILMPRFLAYTDRVTKALGVQSVNQVTYRGSHYQCPQAKKGGKPIVLVPSSLLKPLPVALDIEQALDNADLNDATRGEVNKIFANARKHKTAPQKRDFRAVIRANPKSYKQIMEGYRRASSTPYDFDVDPLKVADVTAIALEIAGSPSVVTEGLSPSDRVEKCLSESVEHFKHSVEQNRLCDLLFDDFGKPRKELFSQRLLFSIAQIFAKRYNVDVSREGNAGPGAVDFRFTVGHKDRLLVELKLSNHERLLDGYYEQLPAYGAAEKILRLVLIIVRVEESDKHLDKLRSAINKTSLPIDLIIVDAIAKPSASKRKHKPTDNDD